MNILTQANSEYQRLAKHLFYNLNKDFKHFYKSTTNTVANSKACTGILVNDELYDLKITFIAYKLPELVIAGVTKETYKENQSLVLNTYKNMVIDMWRKNKTERKHIVYLERTYTDSGEEMDPINNIPETTEAYDKSIDHVWEQWATYVKTLNPDLKVLTQHWVPGSETTFDNLSKRLGVPKTTIQWRINKIRAGFKAYIIDQGDI